MRCIACSARAASAEATVIVPSSAMSMVVPVSSVSARIVAPPLPITSRIFSGLIFIVYRRGANGLSSSLAPPTASTMRARMCRRASLAWASATCMISLVMPWILMSICSAVTPVVEPATLKSMSPRWSSSPRMSVSTAKRLPSLIRPIAMPATCAFIGTPASISARQPPQTEAIDDEPLLSVISLTTRIT